MRALIQRVSKAAVYIDHQLYASIDQGLLVFLGIEQADGEEDIPWLVNKLVNLRIFGDEEGKMNLSVKDVGGEILIVSQFTLHADTKKGFRPSFARAKEPKTAQKLYEIFVEEMKKIFSGKIVTGKFGAYMLVELINDGPVTIMIDSKRKDL
jgi:D-tyrosyl-tRNA(Tyr) deacylase